MLLVNYRCLILPHGSTHINGSVKYKEPLLVPRVGSSIVFSEKNNNFVTPINPIYLYRVHTIQSLIAMIIYDMKIFTYCNSINDIKADVT